SDLPSEPEGHRLAPSLLRARPADRGAGRSLSAHGRRGAASEGLSRARPGRRAPRGPERVQAPADAARPEGDGESVRGGAALSDRAALRGLTVDLGRRGRKSVAGRAGVVRARTD